MVGLLPILSATPPSKTDPIAMPSNSVDSTQPSVALSIPHSLAMPGAAKLIDRTSKPSMAFNPTVTITAAHCQKRMTPWSIIDFGSLDMFRSPRRRFLFVDLGEQAESAWSLPSP